MNLRAPHADDCAIKRGPRLLNPACDCHRKWDGPSEPCPLSMLTCVTNDKAAARAGFKTWLRSIIIGG